MIFVPNKESKIPLYRQLGDFLIDQIMEYPERVGTILLPEREMSCAYGVSRSTVRQALQYMESRHVITRKRGSGTFVAEQNPVTSLMQMYSFTQEMQRAGKIPSSKLISFAVITDYSSTVQNALRLKPGSSVYKFQRLRYADNEIKMLETTYLPFDLLPDMDGELLGNQSLYSILREKYHISLNSAVQEFEVSSASHTEAKLLGIQYDEPVMIAVRTSFDGEQPVEYSRCTIPRGGMRYRVELKM